MANAYTAEFCYWLKERSLLEVARILDDLSDLTGYPSGPGNRVVRLSVEDGRLTVVLREEQNG